MLADGDEINVSGMNFTVVATPGHTKGSVCYLLKMQFFLVIRCFAVPVAAAISMVETVGPCAILWRSWQH